jgi:hypothetical protein
MGTIPTVGHRANIVFVDQGQVSIRCNKWAGLSMGQIVICGQRELDEHFDLGDERDHLLNDAWSEGSVLVDRDAKLLLFYVEHGPLCDNAGLRRAWLALMQEDWPGWTIRWAYQAMGEIADHLGIDRAELGENDTTKVPPTIKSVIQHLGVAYYVMNTHVTIEEYRLNAIKTPYSDLWDSPSCEGVLTIRFADGRITDFSGCWDVNKLLCLGPDLVGELADRAGHSLPNEFYADSGAFIDITTNRISFWPPPHNLDLGFVRGIWPGFDIQCHDEGLPGQAAQSGRDPDSVRLTPHMLIWLGVSQLNMWDDGDLQKMLETIAVGLESGNPLDRSPLDASESSMGDHYQSILERLAKFGRTQRSK